MNKGKIFERDFMDSIPAEWFYHRPPDSAQAFELDKDIHNSNQQAVRFSRKSPCDLFVFTGHFLYLLELKDIKTGRVTYDRPGAKGHHHIHKHQMEYLEKKSKHPNVSCGFVINFEDGGTWYLPIDEFKALLEKNRRCSFNEEEMLRYSNPVRINKTLKKTHYRYDVLALEGQ